MKKLFVIFLVFWAVAIFSQTVVFEDDFESGTGQWTLEGTWALSTEQSYSPTHSLTEDPDWNGGAQGGSGGYLPNQNISATLASPLDLSTFLDAEIAYWAKVDIEVGFDYMYLEASIDGTTWVTLMSYDEEDVDWYFETIPFGGFVGNPSVLIRFRFVSDGAYETDGMYIDDFTVTGYTEDNAAPLIVHVGPEFYEGTAEDYDFEAEIIDISGVTSADVVYTIDGGDDITLPYTSNVGDIYYFTIPFPDYGDQIDYRIVAVDSSPNSNSGESEIFSYIAGTHLIYDNGQVDFYIAFATGTGAAVKMTNPPGQDLQLHFALIRNYTDINNPNSDMLVHVWDDNYGVPGNDLITPFSVTPEATLENTSPMTRVDLRPYAAQLTDIQGDFYIGFTVPTGTVNCTETSPGPFSHSYTFNGTFWAADAADFHFRSVIELTASVPPGTVEGEVTNIDSGDPIEEALVTIGIYSGTTNSSGEYSIDVDPGTYTLTCEKEGYETYTQEDIVVVSYDVITIDIQLQHMYNPPQGLTYQVTGSNVVLQWNEPEEPTGLTGYNIYRNDELYGNTTYTWFSDMGVPAGTYTYYVTALYFVIYESISSNEVIVEVVSAGGNLIPTITELTGNYPNPFNPTTTISFSLEEPCHVTLAVFNIKGKKIRDLVDAELKAAYHSITWNGKDNNDKPASSGVYFYKMKAGGRYTSTKKMILMK
ncbi:MAG: carboxypeptidase regulatory-like domain-containing protein [Candidatus Cloacimonetes bacterium]|nr:carboxypeptidase regulatory-like domain-containing protein [Candidatus Cloacimonadota bacterium]